MFVVFVPVPYVDATASCRFPSKWEGAGVAAAGMVAELAIGAGAVYVWLGRCGGRRRVLFAALTCARGVLSGLFGGLSTHHRRHSPKVQRQTHELPLGAHPVQASQAELP
jgi:hypothetical protein